MIGRRSPQRLFESVDISWLVLFRIVFGVLLAWHAYSYLSEGWVAQNWIGTEFHFKYPGFGWVRPWAGDGMLWHFRALMVLALCVAAGAAYRPSAILLCLGHTHVLLIDEACYQNHTYLFCTLALLLVFLPAHHAWSVDAWLRPRLRRRTLPAWMLAVVRFQIGVPYLFGGIAKLNVDWLQGEPLRGWLAREIDLPLIGPHLDDQWAVLAFSWGGCLLDLLAVPLLLWRRTRTPMFAALFLFHCTNSRLFNIGVFPWAMLALTCVYFAPDAPRRLLGCLWPRPDRRGAVALAGAVVGAVVATWFLGRIELPAWFAGGVAGACLGWRVADRRPASMLEATAAPSPNPVVLGLASLFVMVQILVPLRHLVIPGNVAWTTEGGMFAWQMKLNDREGGVQFTVGDPSRGPTLRVDPKAVLPWWQVQRMIGRPYRIQRFAVYLAERYAARVGPDAPVRADAMLALNHRPERRLIDPEVDLTRVRVPWFGGATWILPAAPRGDEAAPR